MLARHVGVSGWAGPKCRRCLAHRAVQINFAGDLHLKRWAKLPGGQLRTVQRMENIGRSQGTERPQLELVFAPLANTSRTIARGM